MQIEQTVQCKHCGGNGSCTCYECVKKSGCKPSGPSNNYVICKACNGSGLQRV